MLLLHVPTAVPLDPSSRWQCSTQAVFQPESDTDPVLLELHEAEREQLRRCAQHEGRGLR